LVSLWFPFGLAVTSYIVLDEPLCVSYCIHHQRVLNISGPFFAGLPFCVQSRFESALCPSAVLFDWGASLRFSGTAASVLSTGASLCPCLRRLCVSLRLNLLSTLQPTGSFNQLALSVRPPFGFVFVFIASFLGRSFSSQSIFLSPLFFGDLFFSNLVAI
jgi:hypothetical protein